PRSRRAFAASSRGRPSASLALLLRPGAPMACVQTHPQATDLLCPWGCLHFAQALIRFETFPDERKSERCGHDSSKTQYLDRGNIDQGFSQNYERRVKDGRHEITGARAPNRFLSSNFRKLLMGARSSVTR